MKSSSLKSVSRFWRISVVTLGVSQSLEALSMRKSTRLAEPPKAKSPVKIVAAPRNSSPDTSPELSTSKIWKIAQ